MGILLDRNGTLNGCALLALLAGIMAGGSLIVVAAVDGSGQAAHTRLDAMAGRGAGGGGAAGEAAAEYERAGIVASLYDMAGDEWAVAAAHRRAALSAENAAAEWAETAELLGEHAAGHGTGYERVRAAEARAAEWLSAAGAARGMAAEAAAEAGYRRAAAEARAGAAGIAAGADAAAEANRRVAAMIDRLAGADHPRAPPSFAAAAAGCADDAAAAAAAAADRRVASMMDRLSESGPP